MKRIIVAILMLTLLVSLAITGTSCCLCEWTCGNPSIDVEKYISTDIGQTWIDADTPEAGPDVYVGDQIKYKFVVTNTGDVTLTNITLSDSNYDLSSGFNVIPITDPLPPGASFEGILWYIDGGAIRALEGQQTNTATATGDYGGITYFDTDDANYFGMSVP